MQQVQIDTSPAAAQVQQSMGRRGTLAQQTSGDPFAQIIAMMMQQQSAMPTLLYKSDLQQAVQTHGDHDPLVLDCEMQGADPQSMILTQQPLSQREEQQMFSNESELLLQTTENTMLGSTLQMPMEMNKEVPDTADQANKRADESAVKTSISPIAFLHSQDADSLTDRTAMSVQSLKADTAVPSEQDRFHRFVREPKPQILIVPKQQIEEQISFEQVGSRQIETASAATPQKIQPIANKLVLAEQIQTQVNQNIALKQTKFTMKLKPESLGEITVKLIEKQGKTVLHISAAQESTVKLLNQEIAVLREAMKPFEVEVQQVVTQPNQTIQADLQQQFQMNQQFTGQGHAFSPHMHTPFDEAADSLLQESEETSPMIVSDHEIDTYI